MTPQQIIAWLMYNREFVAVGATLLALVYGAIIEARGEKADRVSREAVAKTILGSRRNA